jgi:hypothetical protein
VISGAVLEHFGLHFGIKKVPKGYQNTYKNKTCKYIAFLEGFRGLWAPRGGGGRLAAAVARRHAAPLWGHEEMTFGHLK